MEDISRASLLALWFQLMAQVQVPEELIAFSRGRQAKPLIAPAQPGNDGKRSKHHPGLADHLAFEEGQAAESQIEEYDTVDDEAHGTACHDGEHKSILLQGRVDEEIGRFREQKGSGRCCDKFAGREK